MEHLDNTIYYTFSTIAQVLAAIVGIIGAFAIFRIQAFKDSLYGMARNFYDRLWGTDYQKRKTVDAEVRILGEAINNRKPDEIPYQMRQIIDLIDNEDPTYQILTGIVERYKNLTISIENRIIELKQVFIYCLSVILFSIIVLILTPIICHPVYAYILFIISIIACSFCFFRVYKFMDNTIN